MPCECVNDVLIDSPKFPAGVCRAMNHLAQSKPFRGDYEERCNKFRTAVEELNAATELNVAITFDDPLVETSINSGIDWRGGESNPVIVMRGRLSVTTFLYLYAGCMTPYDPRMGDHWGRMRWAANIVKRFFPRSFSRLDGSGPYLVARDNVTDEPSGDE